MDQVLQRVLCSYRFPPSADNTAMAFLLRNMLNNTNNIIQIYDQSGDRHRMHTRLWRLASTVPENAGYHTAQILVVVIMTPP